MGSLRPGGGWGGRQHVVVAGSPRRNIRMGRVHELEKRRERKKRERYHDEIVHAKKLKLVGGLFLLTSILLLLAGTWIDAVPFTKAAGTALLFFLLSLLSSAGIPEKDVLISMEDYLSYTEVDRDVDGVYLRVGGFFLCLLTGGLVCLFVIGNPAEASNIWFVLITLSFFLLAACLLTLLEDK